MSAPQPLPILPSAGNATLPSASTGAPSGSSSSLLASTAAAPASTTPSAAANLSSTWYHSFKMRMSRSRSTCDEQFVSAKAMFDDYAAHLRRCQRSLRLFVNASTAAAAHADTAVRAVTAVVLASDAPYKAVADKIVSAHSVLHAQSAVRPTVCPTLDSAVAIISKELAECDALQQRMTTREAARAELEYYQQKCERIESSAHTSAWSSAIADRLSRNHIKLADATKRFQDINNAVIAEMADKWGRRMSAVGPALRDVVNTERAIVAEWRKVVEQSPDVDVNALATEYEQLAQQRLPLIRPPQTLTESDEAADMTAAENVSVVEVKSAEYTTADNRGSDRAPQHDDIAIHTAVPPPTEPPVIQRPPPLPPRPRSLTTIVKSAGPSDDTPLTPSPPHKTVDDHQVSGQHTYGGALRPAPVALPMSAVTSSKPDADAVVTLSDLLNKSKVNGLEDDKINETRRDDGNYEKSAQSKRVRFED